MMPDSQPTSPMPQHGNTGSGAGSSQPPAQAPNPQAEQALQQQAHETILNDFLSDPIGFIQDVVNQSAEQHLANLKDEAELKGAMRVIRRDEPDFERFQPFILQEVAKLIENDPDGVLDPWDDLLRKGLKNFKEKFKKTLAENPELLLKQQQEAQKPLMEGATPRKPRPRLPSFTREEIAQMSVQEFIQNEQAIEQALRMKRIQ